MRSSLALVPCRTGSMLEAITFGPDGELIDRQQYALSAHGLPCAIFNDRVYVSTTAPSEAGEASFLDVFSLDRTDGALERVATTKMPARMAHLAIHPDGATLYGASFPQNLLVAYAVRPDGLVEEGPHWQDETPRQPHMAKLSPDARFLYVPCMGADRVMTYRVDGDGRLLTADEAVLLAQPAGSGPRHLAWHPHLPIGYLVCELSGDVVVLARDEASGRLTERSRMSARADTVEPPVWASEIKVSPDGRFLYCAERRGSTLAWWRLDGDGTPSARSIMSCESHPRGFDLSACGRVLVLAGQDSDSIGFYRVDADTGRPERFADIASAAQPSFVEIVALDAEGVS